MDKKRFSYGESDLIYSVKLEQRLKSRFDSLLQEKWTKCMEENLFRYQLPRPLPTRLTSGPLGLVLQLNPARATSRRKPEAMTTLKQPFNHDAFHFLKIDLREILFELEAKLDNKKEDNQVIESDPNSNVHNTEESFANELATSLQHAKPKDPENKKIPFKNVVAINVSPLEFGHCLFIPDIEAKFPQLISKKSQVVSALHFFLLSASPDFRLCFNSLCAFASVNHLHFHCYYLAHRLKLETIALSPIKKGSGIHVLTNFTCRAFGIAIKDSTDVEAVSDVLTKLAEYCAHREIAYNIYVTRGSSLYVAGSSEETVKSELPNGRTIRSCHQSNSLALITRIFFFPRRRFLGAKAEGGHPYAAFNAATAELAGHVIVADRTLFDELTEDSARTVYDEANLNEVEWNTIFEYVKTDLIIQ